MIGVGVDQAIMRTCFCAIVIWEADAARYCVFSPHLAVVVHDPVLLFIVTVTPVIEQEPVAVILGAIPELEAAATVNVDR